MDYNSDLPKPQIDLSSPPRTCWSAIFSGALIGVGLGFLLQLYGIAIGLSAYNSSPSGTATIAIGGMLGFLIGIIASMGAAGFVSGYLGRFHCYHCHSGIIYGFLTWSIALLLGAIMMLPFTHYATAYTKALAPTLAISNTLPQKFAITPDTNASSTTQTKKGEGIQPEVKVTPNTLIGSSWIVFILFFIGALSSCIGACWGMNYRRTCHGTTDSTPPSSPTIR